MRRHPHPRWERHGPPPFLRGLGCLFTTLVIISVTQLARADRLAPALVIGAAIVAITVAFVFTIRRVTQHFRAQDRLRRQLMADVAHELRTPLAILQGRIEGLLDGVYPRDDARLEELLDETRHLSRLVEDLRTISNAEAGALELHKENVDPGELIRDAASSFERRIDVEIEEELPSIDVDPVRIREVLLNLLTNAERHTGVEGVVSIQARAEPRNVVIRVVDTGSGIPPEELPRIFDRFYKGSGSRGSGLGLAIARDLVRAHGGMIEATSAVGRGTTVTISLPRG